MKQKKGKIILGIFLALVLGIVGVQTAIYFHKSKPASLEPYTGSAPYITTDGKAMVSAHRSGGVLYPEETMAAFKNCVESTDFATDVFEFDLHITKDGVLVLLHDDTLDRTSDCQTVFGEEKVRPESKTYEELRQLNMGANFVDQDGQTPYKGLTGESVPDDVRILRVEAVLDYLRANGAYKYIIEIKNGGDLGKKGVEILYTLLAERDMVQDVIFGTFHGEVSKYVDEKYPDLSRSAGITEVLQFYFASFLGMKLDVNYMALQIPYKLYGFNLGSTRIINYAHSMDLAVQYWTINDPDDVEYLNSIGADCIMSDDPGMAYRVINGESN